MASMCKAVVVLSGGWNQVRRQSSVGVAGWPVHLGPRPCPSSDLLNPIGMFLDHTCPPRGPHPFHRHYIIGSEPARATVDWTCLSPRIPAPCLRLGQGCAFLGTPSGPPEPTRARHIPSQSLSPGSLSSDGVSHGQHQPLATGFS
jgi:hypothetical protein